jgi:hypothetical protein
VENLNYPNACITFYSTPWHQMELPKWSEASSNTSDNIVDLTSGQTPNRHAIDRRDCSQAYRRTLGSWPNPAGTQDKQFTGSLLKSQRFTLGVIKAPMTIFEASASYWTMCLPSITFGFSSITMNHQQLEEIQKTMINAILPKMGYS